MNLINISVRTDRLNTNEDVMYAIENRLEQLQGRKYEVPKMTNNPKKHKLSGVGIYQLVNMCLP